MTELPRVASDFNHTNYSENMFKYKKGFTVRILRLPVTNPRSFDARNYFYYTCSFDRENTIAIHLRGGVVSP